MRLMMMKVNCLMLGLLLVSGFAVADTYQVTFGWNDPTTYNPSDTPEYEARYRVDGAAEVLIPGLSLPGGAVTITADPGAKIEVSGAAVNGDLRSLWTAWVSATAPHPPTQPLDQTSFSVTVTRTGP